MSDAPLSDTDLKKWLGSGLSLTCLFLQKCAIRVETYTCQLYNCNIFEMVLQGCHGGIFSLLCWKHFQNPFKLFTISITSDMIRLFLLFEGNFFQNLSLNIFHRGGYVVPGSPGSKSFEPKEYF